MRIVPSLLATLLAAREALGFAPAALTAPSLSRSAKSSPAAVAPSPFRSIGAGHDAALSQPSSTRLLMGWGPDPVWSTGLVESNIQACPSGSCVSIKVNVDDGSDFVYPGQYVQVKPAGGRWC